MKKSKFYVVWEGREQGVFATWEQCEKQVVNFPNAKFKAYPSEAEARAAFRSPAPSYSSKKSSSPKSISAHKLSIAPYIRQSIAVDGAWNTKTGLVEYQGVKLDTKEVLFLVGPYEDGTNNIAEFLAIVHAISLCKKNGWNDMPIYSDSKTAISWVRTKKANTKHDRSQKNEPLFLLVDRAVDWLKSNAYTNKILKWETEIWGENPADFGRK